jgi:heme oxygenase
MHHHHHPHAGSEAPVNPNDLAVMLKQGTQDLHDRAENHDFQQRFASGRISRTQYGLFLSQMLSVHAALEPNLRTLTTKHPIFRDLVADHQFRYDLIRRDLADLGVRHESCVVYAPTRKFTQYIEDTAKNDPIALVGVLYVKEGATNGNKIIVKHIRQSLGLTENEASRYLDPHGAEQRKRWMAFKGMLSTIPVTDEEKARIVAAARMTFELIGDLSEHLSKLEGDTEMGASTEVTVSTAACPVTAAR